MPMAMTMTMCAGCGQNREPDAGGGFAAHHMEHDGVGGPPCPGGRPWRTWSYDPGRFPFPALVALALGEDDLESLRADLPRRTWRTDQQSPWHAPFYEGFGGWRRVFRAFVREAVAPRVGEPFYYQAVPTFRVHLPGNVAVGEFHTDARYHHPPGEVSHWVPLTRAGGTRGLWIEGDDGERHAPDVRPGHVVDFDAVHSTHGNLVNRTGLSRVSFDFRTLPVRLLPAEEGPPTEHTRMRFVPGGYYAAGAVAP